MSEYKIVKLNGVDSQIALLQKTDANGMVWTIPEDPDNVDYRAYLDWVAQGNEAEETD